VRLPHYLYPTIEFRICDVVDLVTDETSAGIPT
jgi:hypothetical protein